MMLMTLCVPWVLEKLGRLMLMMLVCAVNLAEASPARLMLMMLVGAGDLGKARPTDADDAGLWCGFWKTPPNDVEDFDPHCAFWEGLSGWCW